MVLQNLLMHGLFKYKNIGYPEETVVWVQFLAQGNIALDDYNLVPVTLNNVVRMIQQKFLSKKYLKFVVAVHSLHNYMNELNIWHNILKTWVENLRNR